MDHSSPLQKATKFGLLVLTDHDKEKLILIEFV